MSPRASWLDALRLGGGIASLVGALGVALLVERALPPDAAARVMVAIVLLGLLAFSAGLISLGRDVSRRWIAFGATLGFTPASRRSLFDLGTDRPTLYGQASDHALRMRLVLTRARTGTREWIELETDILGAVNDALVARAHVAVAALRARGVAVTHVRIEAGRLCLRAPFPEGDGAPLLHALASVADVTRLPA